MCRQDAQWIVRRVDRPMPYLLKPEISNLRRSPSYFWGPQRCGLPGIRPALFVWKTNRPPPDTGTHACGSKWLDRPSFAVGALGLRLVPWPTPSLFRHAAKSDRRHINAFQVRDLSARKPAHGRSAARRRQPPSIGMERRRPACQNSARFFPL